MLDGGNKSDLVISPCAEFLLVLINHGIGREEVTRAGVCIIGDVCDKISPGLSNFITKFPWVARITNKNKYNQVQVIHKVR